MEKRRLNGVVCIDTRKFFKFKAEDGRLIETKAASEKEAQYNIERCLKIKLKEAA